MNTFSINPNTSFLDVVFQIMAFHRDPRMKVYWELMNYLKKSSAAQTLSQVQLFNSYGVKCSVNRDTVMQAYDSIRSLGNTFIESCVMTDIEKLSCKQTYKQICDNCASDTIKYLAQTGQLNTNDTYHF